VSRAVNYLAVRDDAAFGAATEIRAFHAAATHFERDEIAARQLYAATRTSSARREAAADHEHELFLAMKDQA
jgi:hypothetical protein